MTDRSDGAAADQLNPSSDSVTRSRGDLDIVAAARALSAFARSDLTSRVGDLERCFTHRKGSDVRALLDLESVNHDLLDAAYLFKRIAGQINVTIHTLGILLCLPHLLESGETVEYLSLGAGNTGKKFDLETDLRVAEFKFIHWKGGAEVIRQNALFKDFYGLAEHPTSKQKFMYVLDTEHPIRFLRGRRSLESIMSRNRALWTEFRARYGERFTTVGEYFSAKEDEVKVESVVAHVPALGTAPPAVVGGKTRRPEFVNGTASYSATRLLFRADVIEPLQPTDRVRIETPGGTFEMTKADFYRVFDNVARSKSYQEGRIYHYVRTPEKAYQFLLK